MKLIKLYKLLFFIGAILVINACSDDETDLGPAPTAAFILTTEGEIEEGEIVDFTNQSSGGESFLWSFGDGKTAYGDNVSHSYTLPGTYTVTLESSANGQRSISTRTVNVVPAEGLYFIDNNRLKIRKVIFTDPIIINDVVSLPDVSYGLEVDEANNQIYYTDGTSIYRNSLNGQAEENITTDLNNARDIALDLSNDRIFVTERSSDQVTSVNVNTGGKAEHFSVADDPNYLLPIGVDIYDESIYSTAVDFDAETVWRADLNGDNLTKLIDYFDGGFGYSIRINTANERIYFDDADRGNILSANLDGSDISTIGETSDDSYGIAFDYRSELVYWSDLSGLIRRANFDGSNEEILIDSDNEIRGIDYYSKN